MEPIDVSKGSFVGTVGLLRKLADQLESTHDCVAEIIKNSYDADAQFVQIDLSRAFESVDTAEIQIWDDGIGMDAESVRKNWDPLGHNDSKADKDKEPSPKFGRIAQGGKGLGRTGVFQIGERISVVSKMEGRPAVGFTDDISNIPNSTKLADVNRTLIKDPDAWFTSLGREHGTCIIIEKFRKPLARTASQIKRFCEKMNQATSQMFDPFDIDESWRVDLQLPPNVKFDGKPDYEALLDQALYRGQFTVHGTTIQGTVTNRNTLSNGYGASETVNVAFDEMKRVKSELRHEVVGLSDVSIDVAAYNFKTGVYNYNKIPGFGDLYAKSFVEHFSGVHVYRDGVRVFLDNVDDPVFIDHWRTKVKAGAVFQTSQLMVNVHFSQAGNEGLKQGPARRWFLDTPHRAALTSAVREAVKLLKAHAGEIPQAKPKRMLPPEVARGQISGECGEAVTFRAMNIGGPVRDAWVDIYPIGLDVSMLPVKVEDGQMILKGHLPETAMQGEIKGKLRNDFGTTAFSVYLDVIVPPVVEPVPPLPHLPVVPEPSPSGDVDSPSGHTWSNWTDVQKSELQILGEELHGLSTQQEPPSLDALRQRLTRLKRLIDAFDE